MKVLQVRSKWTPYDVVNETVKTSQREVIQRARQSLCRKIHIHKSSCVTQVIKSDPLLRHLVKSKTEIKILMQILRKVIQSQTNGSLSCI